MTYFNYQGGFAVGNVVASVDRHEAEKLKIH